jgi:TBC1 domain family member 13
VYNNLEEQ